MQIFSYTLAGNTSSSTRTANGPFYAFSRKLDPVSGDVVFDPSAGSWSTGHPMAERIIRCLRTPKGSALRDPNYGLDPSAVDNARQNAPAVVKAAIESALRRYVDAGLMILKGVEVDVQDSLLLVKIVASDPRDQAAVVTVNGSL